MTLSYELIRKEILKANKDRLDDWFAKQTSLLMDICDNLALAYSKLADLKLSEEFLEVSVSSTVRRQLEAELEKKPTEKAIKEAVEEFPDLKELKLELRKAEDEHIKWNNLKYQFENKKDAMKELSKLIGQQYMS